MERPQAPDVLVRRATVGDVDALVPLFDKYRQFYRQPSDEALAYKFLTERMDREESVVFYATVNTNPAGFTQLFPSFSSAAARRTYILNDLYVKQDYRRIYVASRLLRAGARFAKENGAIRLSLASEVKNKAAKALFKKEGWRENTTFAHYVLSV